MTEPTAETPSPMPNAGCDRIAARPGNPTHHRVRDLPLVIDDEFARTGMVKPTGAKIRLRLDLSSSIFPPGVNRRPAIIASR